MKEESLSSKSSLKLDRVNSQSEDTIVTSQLLIRSQSKSMDNASALSLNEYESESRFEEQRYGTPKNTYDRDANRERTQSPLLSPANEVVGQMLSTAFDVATKTAAVVYQTSKDVFNTLQANDKYVPNSSTWSPNKSSWTPPSKWMPTASRWSPSREEWVPSKEQWIPSDDKWVPSEEKWIPSNEQWQPTEENMELFRDNTYSTVRSTNHTTVIDQNTDESTNNHSSFQHVESHMQQLIDMGFLNIEKNQLLLQKYENNVENVLQELLDNA